MRFEVKFTGCPACGGDHYSVIDRMEEFKPELGYSSQKTAERLAQILNERWKEVRK